MCFSLCLNLWSSPLLLFFFFKSNLLLILAFSQRSLWRPASSKKRSNSIQKSTDCCSDWPNYRGSCQCGQSAPKQTHKTPTLMQIEHLFKFSAHLKELSILKCLDGCFWHQGGYYHVSTLVSAPPQAFTFSCHVVLFEVKEEAGQHFFIFSFGSCFLKICQMFGNHRASKIEKLHLF